MDKDDTIETLNDLIEISKDGEYGFRASAEQLKSPETQQLFMRRAEECRSAATELQQLVVQLGGKADDSGTVAGAMHRGWVAVKGTLSGYDDAAVLNETERGEDTALKRYREALDEDLPATVRQVVQRQYEGVKRNHEQVRALRDRARQSAT